MAKIRPTSEAARSSESGNGRRSFIRKTGAALSAVIASAAAGFSKSAPNPDNSLKDRLGRLSNRLGRLEDAAGVRRLHRLYESALDRGLYEDIAALFTEDGEVIYNGGLFQGREGIRRLYCGHFASGHTGKKIEPAPGFEPDPAREPDIVEVAEDRRTAAGRFPYSIQAGAPMDGDSSLVAMARLQGEGILKWWERGTCEASYVKIGEIWKIRRMEYHASLKADYRPGKGYAKPIEVPAFDAVFPENPSGPDKLV